MLLLLAAALWWWVAGAAVRVHVIASVSEAGGATGWACEWVRAATGERHGAWAELNDHAPEVLEVDVSGIPHEPGTPFEFWLYRVTSDSEESPDLVSLLDAPQTEETKKWIPFEQGPGIIFVGQGAGHLVVPIKGRCIQIVHARTPRGGNVTFRYRGEATTVDCYSATGTSNTVLLPSPTRVVPAGELRQRLPTYRVSDAFVSWSAAPGATVRIGEVRERYTFGGVRLFQRNLVASAATDVEPVGEGQWRVTGPHPSVHLQGKWRPRVWCHFAGMGVTFLVLAVVAAMTWWVAGGKRIVYFECACPAYANNEPTPLPPPSGRGSQNMRSPRSVLRRAAAMVLGAAAVVAVHAAVAASAPVIVTADGMDYIVAADDLARNHGLWSFPPYKAPGLSVVVAGAMMISDDFLTSYGWISAVLAVAMSVMTFVIVRRRCGFWWAYAAGMIVGLHPALLVYQAYLLRELPAAAILTAVALLLVLLRDSVAQGKTTWAWVWAVLLAAACAAGAYMRENLQLLIPLVPVLVLLPGAGGWKGRLARAGFIAAGSIALLMPRLLVIHEKFGNWSVVCPKVQANRMLSAWANRVGDANDTALMTRERWQQFSAEHIAQPKSDYEFTNLVLTQSLMAKAAGVGPEGPSTVALSEQLAKSYMDETVARSPLKAARAAARAFISQVGLWSFQTGPAADVAAANEWYSRLLRGEAVGFASNYGPDTVPAMYNPRLGGTDRIKELIAQSRRSVKTLEDGWATRLFNEWFYAFGVLRPVVAVLFFAGIVAAVRRRDLTMMGIGAIAVLSMVGAAVVVGTPTDRFSVPFIPMMVCMGVYAVSRWRQPLSLRV